MLTGGRSRRLRQNTRHIMHDNTTGRTNRTKDAVEGCEIEGEQQDGGSDPSVSDDEVMAALREAWDAGDRDLLEGGVPPTKVAARVALSRSGADTRLRELGRQGRVDLVWGINPDTYRARRSYAPADEVENPIHDLPGDTRRGATADD